MHVNNQFKKYRYSSEDCKQEILEYYYNLFLNIIKITYPLNYILKL